jgi:uncharacterized protein
MIVTRRTLRAAIIALLLSTIGVGCYYIYIQEYLPSEIRVAATAGDLPKVERLLRSVDVNRPLGSKSNSVLNRAVEGGNPAIVERVLDAGADVQAISESGMTPLMYAAFFGNPEIVRTLVQRERARTL